jgi:type IV secretion system protein VirB1
MGAAVIPPGLLACAPNVAPITLQAIIDVESAGNPLALNVNGIRMQPPPASDVREAAQTAESYIVHGYSVDIGLMQVNSHNLAALDITVEQVLDPCTNLHAAATILTADYAVAARTRGDGQAALQAALSAYNTGDFYRGFANGYVAKYYGQAGVPALIGGVREAEAAKRAVPSARPDPYTADTMILNREATNVRIE